MTYQAWRKQIASVLHYNGYLNNKASFFWYILDNTDLLERFKLKCALTGHKRDEFCHLTWKDIYNTVR